MTSKRLALSCAALALVMAAVAAAQDPSTEIDSLEQQVKAVTPENPIPRRIYSLAPAYPPEASAIGASGRVMVRAVLDRFGRVADVRQLRPPIVRSSPQMQPDATAVRAATEALLRSASDAVRQWQYDPPADGPIAFDVTFSFAPGIEAALVSQDAAPAAGAGQEFAAAPPPPPPPPPPPVALGSPTTTATAAWEPPRRARFGGDILAPQQIYMPNPVYPPAAEAARVQGVVMLEAAVGPDGRVSDARVLRSIPLLDQAAIDAVTQWRYTPTLMNGVPVPTVMTVTVRFAL
jgi:protein TonB